MPHSNPAWRYSASTGWFCMNPYVRPDVCDGRCQMRSSSVIGSVTGATVEPLRHTRVSANDGMYRRTGSLSSNRPCSHATIAATAVIGFVIE